MLVVLGIITIVGSLALVTTMRSVSASSFRTEEGLLIVSLQKARSESIAGVCAAQTCASAVAHGVHITPSSLVLFEGSAYDASNSANVVILLNKPDVQVAGLGDVVFAPLSAVAVPGTIIFSDSMQSVTITIGSEGQISWSN